MPDCPTACQHFEEHGCSFQTLEGRSLFGYHVALFNVLISRFAYHDQSRPPFISSGGGCGYDNWMTNADPGNEDCQRVSTQQNMHCLCGLVNLRCIYTNMPRRCGSLKTMPVSTRPVYEKYFIKLKFIVSSFTIL